MFLLKGNYDKAIADLTEAIRLRPKTPVRVPTSWSAVRWPTRKRATLTRPSPTIRR